GKGKNKRKNDKKSKGKSEYLAPKARIANMVNDDVEMIAMMSDHKQKEMSVKDLVVRLLIEEDNKLALKDTCTSSYSRSNPKGKGKNKRKNDKKSKGKSEYLAPKARIVTQKFQRTFYNYGQSSHHAAN
nr:hypothetical protein [Tanacetum cinerariifolium]